MSYKFTKFEHNLGSFGVMRESIIEMSKGRVGQGNNSARQSAQRNTKRVRQLKILLPLVCLVIALVIAIMVFRFSLVPGLEFGSTSLSTKGIVMTEPRLTGSNGGNLYNVNALRAIQNLANPKLIDLEKIIAKINRKDGQTIDLTADEGIYDSDNDYLTLSKNVIVVWGSGYSAELESADVDLKQGILFSEKQILLETPQSQLKAGNVQFLEKNKSLKFRGGVNLTINPSKSRDEK